MSFQEEYRASQYPKVMYPFTGERYLLRWYTNDMQQALMVATKEGQLDRMVELLAEEYSDFRLIDYYQGTLCQPSSEIIKKFQDDQLDMLIRMATGHVAMLYNHYCKELGMPMPEGMDTCKKYTNDHCEESDDLGHYSCRNCKNKIVFTADIDHILSEYLKDTPYLRKPAKGTRTDQVPGLPLPKKGSVLVARQAAGVDITRLGNYLGDLTHSVLFYFQGKKLPLKKRWEKLIVADKERRKARELEWEADRETRRLAEHQAKQAELLRYLGK
jgi:hypothetical protein